MRKNQFEELYTKVEEARKLYKAGEQEKARLKYSKVEKALKEHNIDFRKIWTMYDKAKENKNQYIDFNDNIWNSEVEYLVKILRDNGIKKFTFSSGWSDAVKTAWLFTKNGCILEGLIQINSSLESFKTGEKIKIPAYLFKVN